MFEQEDANRVKRVLMEEFELAEDVLTPQASLYTDMGLDSLDSVDLVVALEREFKFKVVRTVDEERIRAIRTLEDLYGFIETKRREIQAPPDA
jgi:acyl carrier protein